MHQIEPFFLWNKYYESSDDPKSPFFGKEYDFTSYQDTIYGYYIDPAWDFIGSETLYIKLLFVHYPTGTAVIEFIGEWNDTLHNDVMHLKRNIIDLLIAKNIKKFILIGENVYNFHGSDDCYYEEWLEEIEDGWITAIGFQDHVISEWKNYNIDAYINYGGQLNVPNWRARKPPELISYIAFLVVTIERQIDSIVQTERPQ